MTEKEPDSEIASKSVLSTSESPRVKVPPSNDVLSISATVTVSDAPLVIETAPPSSVNDAVAPSRPI